ncbi:mannan endo-1,4-beta-mannosidase [Ruminococcus flavefaciens]|uniref:Mannan endo-1,4-beta-mannosidase n=2 Tax=Ruminococcus flavefaciens TaxID=1265 RepID=A0A1H6HVN9_RUMFL|nr:glycosyl hydrolase [Ruminococcus flavefaciens]SEH40196.1 mannan endo-1,4-beta-mannosidase [Ruminococcus flavefaciens]
MKKENMKRAAYTVAAAFIASAAMSFPSALAKPSAVLAADEVLKYEFEDGKTSGGKIHADGASDVKMSDFPEGTDLSGFSGKGFAYLDQKGTTLSVDVDVPEAGLYELNIGYCEPSDPNKKVQYLNVNGVNQGELTCPYTKTFAETSGGVVNLKKGKNTIELKAYWGYTFFDYLTLKAAPEKLTNLSPTRELSNPKASDTTKRLYNYLCDQYGKHIISGQQEYCGDHNYNLWNSPDVFIKDNEAEFEYIEEKTGKQPAIRGIDFLAYNTSSEWRDHAPERVIEWVNKYHGIATVSWHWNVPCEKGSDDIAFYVESANPKFTTFSCKNAVTEGTWEHEVVMADIELIAGELKKLKDADVPVLWRPLHEAEGGWFWWGAEGAEPCKKLYRLLYDQLTNVYGLDNLIWIWTGSTSPAAADWYPGDDVVDIVGYDKYNCADGVANLSSISSTFYSLVQGTDCQKMVAMSENDSIPSLENLVNDKAAWLYFCPWYMNYLTSEQNNPVDNLIEVYQSDYCITLDELPDLKTYPLNGSQGTVTTTVTTKPVTTSTTKVTTVSASKTSTTAKVTTSSTTKAATTLATSSVPSKDYKKGDANCDGNVDMSDAVIIMQSLANPDKYGEKGTDKFHITEQGKINGDVETSSKGLTSNDALEIQKYLLGLSKWD